MNDPNSDTMRDDPVRSAVRSVTPKVSNDLGLVARSVLVGAAYYAVPRFSVCGWRSSGTR
jgi:hypothetical protein